MIIKSLSRKANSAQLVKYVLRYALKDNPLKNKDDATLILKHNVRSRSVNGYIKEFKANEAYRLYKRKKAVELYHDIISFSPRDRQKISVDILKDIARQYVSLRGNSNLYIIAAHTEKEHQHLHCIVSGVQLNGYSSRISKQHFKHLKLELDRYQQEKYPELSHSLITHEKAKQKTREEIIERVQEIRQTDKQTLLQFLEKSYAAALSKEDFLKRLKEQGYDPYYRNDKLQGVTVEGRKFRLNRLGYDDHKLEELNHKNSIEEKALHELQQLRTGNNKELKKEIIIQDETEQKMLAELENIRSTKEEQEIERSLCISENEARADSIESLYEDFNTSDDESSVYSSYTSKKPAISINRFEE